MRDWIQVGIISLLYLYNIPVLFAFLIVHATGVNIVTSTGKELYWQGKVILLLISSIFSTAFYLAFPRLLTQY